MVNIGVVGIKPTLVERLVFAGLFPRRVLQTGYFPGVPQLPASALCIPMDPGARLCFRMDAK